MTICQHCDQPITAIMSGETIVAWQSRPRRRRKPYLTTICDGRHNDIRTAPKDFTHRPVTP